MIGHRILRGVEKDVPVETLEKDYLLLVKPGETLPADGIITEGSTLIDERAIGGEDGTKKFPSSAVYAGTVNGNGRIVVRITNTGEDTRHHQIQLIIDAATKTTAGFEHRAKRMVAIMPIIIIAIALLVGFAFLSMGWQPALIALLSVILVSSPYLYLAGTQRVASKTITELAGHGILVKDAATLDQLTSVDTILFDKTGVLTAGVITVEHVVSFKPYTQQQVLNLAATLEHKSKHPVAEAIVLFAKNYGAVAFQRLDGWKEEPGLGVSGKLNAKQVFVGTAVFMQRRKVKLPQEAFQHKDEGKTVIYVVSGKIVMGYLAVRDELREDSRELMHELKKHYRVVLLSGDHESTAAALAVQAGMHEVIPALQEKRSGEIGELRTSGKRTAHITLGNESAADITITLGKEFADITLLRPDASLLRLLFAAARNAKAQVQRRILAANIYHLIAVPLAAIGYLFIGFWSLVVALALMLGVTLMFFLVHKNGPAGSKKQELVS